MPTCSVVIADSPTARFWTWPIEATLRSLVEHAPSLLREPLTITFDGPNVTLPHGQGRAAAWDTWHRLLPLSAVGPSAAYWGSKCGHPTNVPAYMEYKTRVKVLAQHVLPSVQFVEANMRLCLAGTLRLALYTAVRTPYVLVMQSDMPLKKRLEPSVAPLLALMDAHQVSAVYLAVGSNSCNANLAPRICHWNRYWMPKPSTVHGIAHNASSAVRLTPVRFWSDNNHFADTRFYSTKLWPTYHTYEMGEENGTMRFSPRGKATMKNGVGAGAGFPEWFLFCEPWRNHSTWRTYLLGDSCNGGWSTHLDGRLALGKGQPTQLHVCEGGDGVSLSTNDEIHMRRRAKQRPPPQPPITRRPPGVACATKLWSDEWSWEHGLGTPPLKQAKAPEQGHFCVPHLCRRGVVWCRSVVPRPSRTCAAALPWARFAVYLMSVLFLLLLYLHCGPSSLVGAGDSVREMHAEPLLRLRPGPEVRPETLVDSPESSTV